MQLSSKLYCVKSHGVTRDITDNWPAAFSYSEELRRRLGSHNVQLITITDGRTFEQKQPATKGH